MGEISTEQCPVNFAEKILEIIPLKEINVKLKLKNISTTIKNN